MQSMSERDNRLYVEDMLEFCCASLAYSAGLTEATLTAEAMRYDAILRNLELIGEAATHVPDAVRAMAPKCALATGRGHAQPGGAWLSGHFSRHGVEHPARRLASA